MKRQAIIMHTRVKETIAKFKMKEEENRGLEYFNITVKERT